jgi:putative transposase
MPAPLSVDLRERVVEAYNNKEGTTRELAKRFCISPGTVSNWTRQAKERGTLEPISPPGRPKFWQEAQQNTLREQMKKTPDATLEQVAETLAPEFGRTFHKSTLSRVLANLGLTRKKKTSTPANATPRRSNTRGSRSGRASSRSS